MKEIMQNFENKFIKTNSPGVEYKNNKLYVFDKEYILVLNSYPNVRAWVKTVDKPYWRGTTNIYIDLSLGYIRYGSISEYSREINRMDFHIDKLGTIIKKTNKYLFLKRYDLEMNERIRFKKNIHNLKNFKKWRDQFPDNIVKEAIKYRSRQFMIIQMLSKIKDSIQLSISNPGLFFMLTVNHHYIKTSQNRFKIFKKLYKKKQLLIIKNLGFPEKKSFVKIIKKIRHHEVSLFTLLTLKDILNSHKEVQEFKHLSSINLNSVNYLKEVLQYKNIINTKIIFSSLAYMEYKNMKRYNSILMLIRLIRYIKHNHKYLNDYVDFDIIKVNSFKKINKEIYNLTLIKKIIDKKRLKNIKFFDPPINGIKDKIIPIKNGIELLCESEIQINCAISYLDQILQNKDIYFYKLISPVRATILISFYENLDQWRLMVIKEKHNKDLDDKNTRDMLFKWIAGNKNECLLPIKKCETHDNNGWPIPF